MFEVDFKADSTAVGCDCKYIHAHACDGMVCSMQAQLPYIQPKQKLFEVDFKADSIAALVCFFVATLTHTYTCSFFQPWAWGLSLLWRGVEQEMKT